MKDTDIRSVVLHLLKANTFKQFKYRILEEVVTAAAVAQHAGALRRRPAQLPMERKQQKINILHIASNK